MAYVVKAREEMRKILMDRSTDFLNFNKTCEFKGEHFEGFYIEIEDILDILYEVDDD